MADDGLVAAQRASPWQQTQRQGGRPRIDLVFRFWQCDKENHGWREGLPLTVSAKFRSRGPGLHPPAKSVSNERKNTASAGRMLTLTQDIGRYKPTIHSLQRSHMQALCGNDIFCFAS